MAKSKKEPQDFESTLTALEQIVGHLESGELPLEEALAEFEQAIKLVQLGQERLTQAEQRIQILMQKNENAEPVTYSRTPTSTYDNIPDDETPF